MRGAHRRDARRAWRPGWPCADSARPRPRAGPHRPPALHPAQRVGEDDRERRRQEHHAVHRLDELLEHGVGEREHARWAAASARSGLPARNASAWQEKIAAHIATIDGEHERVSAAATARPGVRACSPTRCEASSACRSVSSVGSPCHVVPREDQEPDDHQRAPPRDTSVASSRFRRSRAQATSAESERHAHQLARSSRAPTNTRPNANAVAIAMAQTATSAISRCARGDVPWGRAIGPSSAWTGGG